MKHRDQKEVWASHDHIMFLNAFSFWPDCWLPADYRTSRGRKGRDSSTLWSLFSNNHKNACISKILIPILNSQSYKFLGYHGCITIDIIQWQDINVLLALVTKLRFPYLDDWLGRLKYWQDWEKAYISQYQSLFRDCRMNSTFPILHSSSLCYPKIRIFWKGYLRT